MAVYDTYDEYVAAGTDGDGLAESRLTKPIDLLASVADAYERALWGGDFFEAQRLAADVLRRGAGLACLYQRLMAPALHRVGDLWESGELSVADEHLATEATLRTMASVAAMVPRRRSTTASRCVLMATAPGERHGVGLRMAADLLELAGHEVVHIGIDTPVEDIARMAAATNPDVVGLSFTSVGSEAEALRLTRAIWDATEPDLPLLVGGQGLDNLPEGPILRVEDLELLTAVVDELPVRDPGPQRLPARRAHPEPLWHEDPSTGPDRLGSRATWRPEATIVIGADHRVIEWNEIATSIFGYGRSEAIGEDVRDLVLPVEQLTAYELLLAGAVPAAERSDPELRQIELVDRAGKGLSALVRASRISEVPAVHLLTLRDPAREQALELHSHQLQALVDESPDAMATVGLDGTVTDWNQAAAELYGYAAEEAIGRRLGPLISTPDSAQAPRRWLRQVRDGEVVESEDLARLYRDGGQRALSVRLLPARDKVGDVAGAALLVRDVTDSRRREQTGERELDHRLWQGRIDHALANDQFLLAAQPIIDLESGRVDHCELLLRMQLGNRIVAPGEFIPVAEASGQIRAIDAWVAARGIELAVQHPVAVNLSGASLTNPTLLDLIAATLERVGVDPGRVTFEITETTAAENIEQAATLVERLRELGCRVALDDFGTGFGSFTYLSRLPVTELKIDNEFTRGARSDEAQRRVVDAVLAIGRSFEARIVAEGIEDSETLDLVRAAGVHLGQGYLFGKPAPIEGDNWLIPPPPLAPRRSSPPALPSLRGRAGW